ncbi:hypothetical protein RB653_002838 [Dictyostelium firmibasis]|uniref:Uncharacterized protein n=1 Tax=Dictyostelium firmibasis TaxID=79012 RepID=A0AAN7U3K5_9MYCE
MLSKSFNFLTNKVVYSSFSASNENKNSFSSSHINISSKNSTSSFFTRPNFVNY